MVVSQHYRTELCDDLYSGSEINSSNLLGNMSEMSLTQLEDLGGRAKRGNSLGRGTAQCTHANHTASKHGISCCTCTCTYTLCTCMYITYIS